MDCLYLHSEVSLTFVVSLFRDKSFLWQVRYSILNRADLLPAFVMSIKWNNSRCVQELYDLLSLWRQPSPIQALQLLDRRFMDPKV